MAVLTASDLAKDVAGRPLFAGVSLRLERRQRLTIAGRNGAGKTTLLRVLAGEESADRGELSRARDARVALHDQRPPRERDLRLRDYVLGGCAEQVRLERELGELERAMADGDAGAGTLDRYGRAQARLEHAGGYRWRDRALEGVRGLGFADGDLDRSLRSFSGGELTRASLARALAGDPDVLLLDEPTNHLDVDALEWLEQRLTGLDAAVALVAHDRWFLEAVGTAVLELEAGRGRGRARRSRGCGGSSASAPSGPSAPTSARSPSTSGRRSAAAGWSSSWRARPSRRAIGHCSRTPSCGWSGASTSRWSGPTAP